MRGARRVATLLALAALGAVPASAQAAADAEVGIADDAVFLHRPADAPRIVARWKAMGIDTVRVHARWIVIAPRPHDRRPPKGFNGSNPDDPRYNWSTLDLAVRLLTSEGIRPIVSITGSGPLWTSLAPARGNHRWKPDPAQFGAFSAAVARRYRGRVGRYIVWNEPNQPGWLQPQFTCRRGACTPYAPHHYRRLYRAAHRSVKAVDPEAQVLIGALAPRGSAPRSRNAPMRPLTFLRAMGCVSERSRPIRSGPCRRRSPLRTDGVAYHPHPVDRAPDAPGRHRDEAAFGDLRRLERVIDRTVARGILRGPSRTRPLELHLTEFAYQTNPPDRAVGIAPRLQARWLSQAAYLAWRNPRVRNVSHYAWKDEKVVAKAKRGARAYSSWQSGLLFADGRGKPALDVFPHPLWATAGGRGRVLLWGQVRPGEGPYDVRVLRRTRSGTGSWTRIARVRTDRHGTWTARVAAPTRPTDYRFTYVLPPRTTGLDRAVRRSSRTFDAVRELLRDLLRPRGRAQRR